VKIFKTEEGRRAVLESYDRLVAAWGVPTEERDLETSYGKTHVILAGAPALPPLLLFHGVGDNSALMWVYNAEELSRHFRLAAIDTMGGAGRSMPDDRYGKGFDLSQWYGDVLSALNIRKTYAAGVSYGCYHVQLLLASFPDKVERIVGMAGSVAADDRRAGKLRQLANMMKMFMPEGLFPTRKNALKIARKMTGRNADALLGNEAIADHFWLLMKHYSMQAQMVHRRRSLEPDEIAAMRGKALFLVGDQDLLTNAQSFQQAMETHGMRYRIFPGAGHAINAEMAVEVNAAIVDFCP
jgi:pimeloyl-ACP methyl ester carboxylesterase